MAFTHSSYAFPNLTTSSFRPKKPLIISAKIPITDRVIDFGKYKGKMLGTIPSTYLKWVSKNLRAGDFQDWATLADQLLQDPVYKDRLEWEFADSVLNGNQYNINTSTSSSNLSRNNERTTAVSQLLAISERFGWDNEDKVGWSKVNFELLGTSKGGRIPRLMGPSSSSSSSSSSGGIKEEREYLRVEERHEKGEVLSENEQRRRERRERVRRKKEVEMRKEKLRIIEKSRDIDGEAMFERKQDWTVEINNNNNNDPFPGREALLKKVLNRKRFL